MDFQDGRYSHDARDALLGRRGVELASGRGQRPGKGNHFESETKCERDATAEAEDRGTAGVVAPSGVRRPLANGPPERYFSAAFCWLIILR